MSNQNVPWANRGRGGGSGVGRGGAGRGGSAEEPSNGDAGADGEEKKAPASPFGERVKRPGSPAAPTSSAAAPDEAAAKPSSGLAASSPFGERVRRSTANSIDSSSKPLAGPSPAATTTTTTTTAAPGSPSVPAKAAPSSPFGARVAAKPGPLAIPTPAAASEEKKTTPSPVAVATAGSGSPSPLLKAAVEKSATAQEDDQDDSSGDETDILKRRTLRGAAPSLIFEQRVAVLANSPRKEKIVYSPEDKQGEPSQEVIESLIPQLDVSASVDESGSVSARLPPKASLLGVDTETMRKRSNTAPAMRDSDEVSSDAEIEVSEQERMLATEGAFGEGSARKRSGTANMTVVEYLSSATKDSPRLRSATKERVVPKAGLRKKPTRRRSSIASSNRAALLKSERPYSSMELSSIPTTEGSSFVACEDGGAMTNSEELSAIEDVNDDNKAGRGTLKTTGRRQPLQHQFTLSADDLAKAQLKRKTSSPEQPRPAPVVNAEETVGMLSRLKKSTSAITAKEEKEEAPLPAFGSGLKKVATKTPATTNETPSPAAASTPSSPFSQLKKAASAAAVTKTEEKKDEPASPFGQLKKTSAPSPKEEVKPEPAAAAAATGPAWAKNLKKNAEAPKEEEKAPAPAPAAAAAATGPAWAKNLKKNTEASKEEPAPVIAAASAPAVTNSPAWAKKKSGETAPKEEEKSKEAPAPAAAASNSPAWARNTKKPTAAEPAKEEEKKEAAPSSASNSPAWAKKKPVAEPVKEEAKSAPAPAEGSNSPAWAKNLKKPTTAAASTPAAAAEEEKPKVATPAWARKNTAPKEEEKPAPAAVVPAAAVEAGGSVSAAAAMFGGRGRGSGVGSGVARGGKFS